MTTTETRTYNEQVWVTWEPKGRDEFGYNPRARRAHLADQGAGRRDLHNGSFPLACGRWAPDGFEAVITESSARRCRRCLKALARREEER